MELFHFVWADVIALGIIAIGFWRALYRCPVGMNPDRIMYWYMGCGWTTLGVIRTYEGFYVSAAIDAGFAAYDFYRWWNAGGGDGIKNFLQSLVMKPAHAVR